MMWLDIAVAIAAMSATIAISLFCMKHNTDEVIDE